MNLQEIVPLLLLWTCQVIHDFANRVVKKHHLQE
jgi:hypothetical protein